MVDETPSKAMQNLNSYYGNKVGFWQSLSLILNAGLMIYAHIGLSAVILSSQDPSITSGDAATAVPIINDTGVCNDNDMALWASFGGEALRPTHSNFCSREYKGGGCLTSQTCIAECFNATYGYSQNCSTCFAAIPSCSVSQGCTLACASDSLGTACQQCNTNCVATMRECSGLPVIIETNSTRKLQTEDSCNEYEPENVDTWYKVYDLTFVGSVQDAWNGNAELLAVIVVFFSGIWPYAKNIMLLMVWYIPMSEQLQTSTLLWLSRLSKYTLVDIFAVTVILVGVQLKLDVGGTEAIIRAEPRFGIVAFFLATVWEFLQIEVVKAMHEQKLSKQTSHHQGNTTNETESETETKRKDRLLFPTVWFSFLLWTVTLGLYVAGATTEIATFTSTDLEAESGCTKTYNLVTLANALVNELSLTDNVVSWQTWILYLVYVLLNLALPIITHLLQLIFMVRWSRQTKRTDVDSLRKLSLTTSAIWCFTGIEVLLIGVFAVEFKFAELVARLAGDSNAVFLDVTSGLGTGFYLLIAYSIFAGLLQFSLRIAPAGNDNGSESENGNGDV